MTSLTRMFDLYRSRRRKEMDAMDSPDRLLTSAPTRMVERSPSPQPSPPGRGRNLRRLSEIASAVFAGPPSANHKRTACCSLSPGERVGVRASVNQTFFSAARGQRSTQARKPEFVKRSPSPRPSPLGEGESSSALGGCERSDLVCGFQQDRKEIGDCYLDDRMLTAGRTVPPLPGGEGRGEGERQSNFFRLSVSSRQSASSPRRLLYD